MTPQEFFAHCWHDYTAMAPQAAVIHQAFADEGETVVNDHVAFRTLALEPLRLHNLQTHLLALGYQPAGSYRFEAKLLEATGYVHADPDLPRVFVSELLVDELSDAAAAILRRCAAAVDPARLSTPSVMWAGRLWPTITSEEYDLLAAESEYAAWVATIGLRPNHFTISINHLHSYPDVESVLQRVESLGFAINDSGGRVKGSPAVLLEQGSTMADRMPVVLADDAVRELPTCYYEFALRHRDSDGQLFQGFVAASADRIFESTDRGDDDE